MRRFGIAAVAIVCGAVGLVLVANLVSKPSSATGLVEAEIVDFDPGFAGPDRIRVIASEPVDPGDGILPNGEPVEPDRVFVAVTGETGCRAPTDAELRRDGERLFVDFAGGQDHEECFRPYTPFVQFAVDRVALRGVVSLEGVTVGDW